MITLSVIKITDRIYFTDKKVTDRLISFADKFFICRFKADRTVSNHFLTESVVITENFDIYNTQKLKTGKIGTRGIPLENGQFRFVVRVIIFSQTGDKVLIQQRQVTKSSFPHFWDFTASGGVQDGELFHEAATRELLEETGIFYNFSNVPSRLTIQFYEGWSEVFIIQKDIPLKDLKLQKSEVSAMRWVSEDELNALIDEGKFIPFHYAKHIFDYIRFNGETSFVEN